jgi:hypothetical protein
MLAGRHAMKLAATVSLFRSTSWALAAACFLPSVALALLVGTLAVPAFFVSTIVLFATSAIVPQLVVRRAFARFGQHLEAERTVDARALLAELFEVFSGAQSSLERLHFMESTLLVIEERYAEACHVVESIDRRRLGPAMDPWIDNQRAWAMALGGRASEAASLARASLETSDPAVERPVVREDLRAYKLATLGTALVLSGDPAGGIPYLEQALARGGKPRAQAARAFYLGEGLRAVGRDDEASKAYVRAAEVAPGSSFAKRALDRAGDLRPYR